MADFVILFPNLFSSGLGGSDPMPARPVVREKEKVKMPPPKEVKKEKPMMKLGKLPPVVDARTLQFKKYLMKWTLAQPAPYADWLTKVTDYGMDLNDQIGDCTIAATAHMIQGWTAYAGTEFKPTDQQVLTAYRAISGYNGNPATDTGCAMLDVLRYWRKTGIAGHKITAFVQVDPQNLTQMKQAVSIFGQVFLGLNMPYTAATQNSCWQVTTVVGDGLPGTWGGHAVNVGAYSPRVLECVTWGQPWYITNNFQNTYADEAYAVFSQDFMEPNQLSASGFNVTQLMADLKAL